MVAARALEIAAVVSFCQSFTRFLLQFKVSGNQVVAMATKNSRNIYDSIHTMADVYPSHAKQIGETLPFVTLSKFEALADGLKAITKATAITFLPMLSTKADLMKRNSYSAANLGWIAESRQVLSNTTSKRVESKDVLPFVWKFGTTSTGEPTILPEDRGEPFIPLWPAWQSSPFIILKALCH